MDQTITLGGDVSATVSLTPAAAQIVINPTGGDDTTMMMNVLNAIAEKAGRGPDLAPNPGAYIFPNGITESVPGLVIRGVGTGCQGPGGQGTQTGVTFTATAPGAKVWRHLPPPGSTGNEYRGPRFSNITFAGNDVTVGSLEVQTCYGIFEYLWSCNNTNPAAIGFKFAVPPAPLNAAARNRLLYCGSQDDFTGLQIGDFAPDNVQRGSAETEVVGFINLKTTAGGIKHLGWGVINYDNGAAISLGKLEGNYTPLLLASTPGICVLGTRLEDNITGWLTDRPSGMNGTRNMVIAPMSGKIGPFQQNDMAVGGDYTAPIENLGTGSILIPNF